MCDAADDALSGSPDQRLLDQMKSYGATTPGSDAPTPSTSAGDRPPALSNQHRVSAFDVIVDFVTWMYMYMYLHVHGFL